MRTKGAPNCKFSCKKLDWPQLSPNKESKFKECWMLISLNSMANMVVYMVDYIE